MESKPDSTLSSPGFKMVLTKMICPTSSVLSPPRLLAVLLLMLFIVSAKSIPRLGRSPRTTSNFFRHSSSSSSLWMDDLKIYNYTQTLDHFNYRPASFTTFQQRYLMNSRYWGGASTSAPIFVYLGGESPIYKQLPTILEDWAPQFKALIVYAEHRYYGESMPFGSVEDAYRNTSTLGYFTTAQALADYAELILSLKKNLSAHTSPVIVFGGSYSGMLASWFRIKYPHIAFGALASSAPIFSPGEDPYYSIVTKDFEESSKSCVKTIRKSWPIINKTASQKEGLSWLTGKFKTCKPIERLSDLKNYLETIYCYAAQYDHPHYGFVNKVCEAIDGGSSRKDILSRIQAGVVAVVGEKACYDTDLYINKGWYWQSCTELIQILGTVNNSMFETKPWDLNDYIQNCQNTLGVSVTPRLHWIATEFGDYNIKLALKNFGSNIIFSNGRKDPWSGSGVLENISDSVVAISTVNGSHCLDIVSASPIDPDWLVEQRDSEIKIMKRWLREYNVIYRNETSGGSTGDGF